MVVYICHSLSGSFLPETQPSLQSMGSGSENWPRYGNKVKNHDCLLRRQPSASRSTVLDFDLFGFMLILVNRC